MTDTLLNMKPVQTRLKKADDFSLTESDHLQLHKMIDN